MSEIEEVLHLKDVKVDSMENSSRKDENLNTLKLAEADHNKYLYHSPTFKAQISSLKHAWVHSQLELCFCNGLEDVTEDKENWLIANEAEQKEQMNKSKKEVENVKRQITEVEEDLKKLSENLQARNERNQKKKLVIDNKLSIIKEKEEKSKKLLERQQKLEKEKQLHFDGSGKDVSNEVLQEKLQQTSGAMKQCMAAIESLNEHKLLLESEQNLMQETLQRLEEELSLLKTEEKSFKNEEQERLRYISNLLMASGLRIIDITNDDLVIEIHDIHDQENSADCESATGRSTIQLTLQLVDVDGQIVVKDVKTNSLTFFIKDIIEQVKSTNKLKIFVLEVQKRFHNQAKLLQEMKILQERFAIDWNDEKQTVRVMLGKAGQIVCTLKIQHGYPSIGHVSIEEIHGADPKLLAQDSSMTKELKSLTSWIEYLSVKTVHCKTLLSLHVS